MPSPVRSLRPLVVALLLQGLIPRQGRADDGVTYKYQSWQEASGRIHVDSQSGAVEQGLPDEIKLKLTGVIDTISGATPTGQITPDSNGNLPTSEIRDRRKAWEGDLTKSIDDVTLSAGFANSRESDYVSNGWSINTQTDFNQKNTTLLAGLAGTDDTVKVFFQNPWKRKRGLDEIIGITQLIDSKTSVTFNLSHDESSGYLSDPYKLIEKHIDVGAGLSLLSTFGENRPGKRDGWIGYASINHSFSSVNGAVEGSYRYYHDTFGINSHTVALQWFQKFFNDRLIVNPFVRYYRQTAADFYLLTLDGTNITPTPQPNPDGPFYSADYRLSKMQTVTIGAKVVVMIIPQRLSIDAAYDRYTMTGLDDFTPKAAYTKANVVTIGMHYTW